MAFYTDLYGIPVSLMKLEADMSFFDSPVARCEAVRELVLTDETQAECAREHDCPAGRICPLCGYFTETSGMAESHPEISPVAVPGSRGR